MSVEHQYTYWHRGRGLYELDQDSVDNTPEEFKDLYLPSIIIAGNQVTFGGDVYGYISKQHKYKYVQSEKYTKPRTHTVFTVKLR